MRRFLALIAVALLALGGPAFAAPRNLGGGSVNLVGVPEVGSVLIITGAPATASCQMLRNGSPISGATSCSSYTVVSGDAGTTLSLRVITAGAPAYAALTISGTPSATGNVGTAYSFTPTSTGGAGTNVFAQTGSLPAGLSFNASTGALTGTPTTIGTSTGLDISVTDALGVTAALTPFSIAIATALTGPTGLDFSQAVNSGYLTAF